MKQEYYQFQYGRYTRLEELSGQQVQLVRSAIEAAGKAYAPYSSYRVGAALLLENGEIITGNNQENAAYPSGMCAERVALFYAGSRFPEVAVTSLAIAALREGTIQEEPVTPCGGCRQVMWEKESQGKRPMEVILYGANHIHVISRAMDLLPLPFLLRGKQP
jgi:cytidine deaminase